MDAIPFYLLKDSTKILEWDLTDSSLRNNQTFAPSDTNETNLIKQ